MLTCLIDAWSGMGDSIHFKPGSSQILSCATPTQLYPYQRFWKAHQLRDHYESALVFVVATSFRLGLGVRTGGIWHGSNEGRTQT